MYLHGTTTAQQKHWVIFCIPKLHGTQTSAEYRHITLLNTGYKILARIIARHIRPEMEELWDTQFYGVPGNTIFVAITTVREAIAQADVTATPLCILSLDFTEAYDKISHQYLFAILERYALSDRFISCQGLVH
jgi:hypothetical protein